MEFDPVRKDMQVLVAYDNYDAGRRAMALLKRVGDQCGDRRRLAHVMLKFELMSDQTFFELAISEALAADIIVIAATEGRDLPQRIKDWIVRWLLMKAERPQAMVATLDYNFPNAVQHGCVLPYLTKLARYGKLKFFSNGKPGQPTDLGTLRTDFLPSELAFARRPSLERN